MEYIQRKGKGDSSCLFCSLADSEVGADGDHIIARSTHCFALLNRYPYTYGHCMAAPFSHVSSPEDMSSAALTDLMTIVNRLMRVLRQIAEPQGFNIGANIGAAAGAGIAAHNHFHVVPRWSGDANFMATIGETQTIADTLPGTAQTMRATWTALYGDD